MKTLQKITSKIFDQPHLTDVTPELGKKVVFTNGCFDLIHTGHITYLAAAADKGESFVVGLNSDASVKRLKGPSRPIKDEMNRALVLASFSFIHAVIIFDEDTPLNLIKWLNPDVLVKGGDYDPFITDPSDKRFIVGSDLIHENGGEVAVIPFVEGYSTTNLITRMNG